MAFLTGCTAEPLVPLTQTLAPELPLTITIKVKDYCPPAGRSHIDYFVQPQSYRLRKSRPQIDWDRDGIVNSEDNDLDLGIHYLSRDTNLDGYGDLLMYVNGILASEQEYLTPCQQSGQDTDNDGLTDCEETLTRTDSLKWDTDGDGLSDMVEIRVGLNPMDDQDGARDLDGDGLSNSREARLHTPVDETNNTLINERKLAYDAELHDETGTLCYQFVTSNALVVNVSNGNLYDLYFIEEDTSHLRHMIRKHVVVPRSIARGTILTFRYEEL